jgi:2-polyprenyl-3-methyl-5-hydroxy-6-metoxy-1,4-benzoquinol methylase
VTAAGTIRSEPPGLSPLHVLLRCLDCGHALDAESLDGAPPDSPLRDGWLVCGGCPRRYPVIAGTARMLSQERLAALAPQHPAFPWSEHVVRERAADDVKARTAASFAYEWERFGTVRPEWERNFRDYLQPLRPEDLRNRLVLDVGTGSGRHSREAARAGAQVVAIDLGASIDVARGNLPEPVLTVQADAEHLPFDPGIFDLVMSIGVLHHLPDPARAFRAIAPYVRPGGRLHVYLYWQPPHRWHRTILRGVTAFRRVTVRLPHRALHALCYPIAAVLFALVVLPYRGLRHRPRTAQLARQLPLKTYADYPFGVCVNDQFDRLSAPIEFRYEAEEVRVLFERENLEDITVLANHGWVGSGIRPAST